MADKPYREMTDDELRAALKTWDDHVRTSPGWASAYFSATQSAAIVREGHRRGLTDMKTEFEIKYG